MSSELVELRAIELNKSFKSRQVVKDVSFSLQKGEVVGLLGPNGAGKTTSFYMVVGLIKADSGTILCHGKDIARLPIHKRARLGIGYLPQEASVFRKLTVEENILAVLQTRKDLNRTDQHDHLEQLLNEFSITHIRKSMGISLSGGERRRVEIARTLSMEPDFILLDEPFAGVDPISVNDIQSIIIHLTEKNIGGTFKILNNQKIGLTVEYDILDKIISDINKTNVFRDKKNVEEIIYKHILIDLYLKNPSKFLYLLYSNVLHKVPEKNAFIFNISMFGINTKNVVSESVFSDAILKRKKEITSIIGPEFSKFLYGKNMRIIVRMDNDKNLSIADVYQNFDMAIDNIDIDINVTKKNRGVKNER